MRVYQWWPQVAFLVCIWGRMGEAFFLGRVVSRVDGGLKLRAARPDVLMRKVAGALVGAAMLAGPLEMPQGAMAAAAVGTTSTLEASIKTLEAAADRKETIQALADVFEASESKTLLVRTKYKYVRLCVLVCLCNFYPPR